MIELMAGSAGVIVEVDREVSYSEVEAALEAQSVNALVQYMLDLTPLSGRTRVQITAHLRTEAITAEGVPGVPAVPVLEAITGALRQMDQ